MDNSLHALCDAIKKILHKLKPQTNPLSFNIVIGKSGQGKTALLKQSNMEEIAIHSEEHAKIYFNQNGIVLELNESWFTDRKSLIQNTLKQLNRCNSYLKITGIILCIDVNELLIDHDIDFTERKKTHIQTLERVGSNLGYSVDLALVFTKMDTLAGFSEFYQTDHAADLSKPLGFSLDCINTKAIKIATYIQHFNQFIEMISQQVIQKMHPARSTIKRSLIRELPIQLTSLRTPIQSLTQGISTQLFNLHSIYFTSAEQGGVSIDRLNKKIQHEYALVVQDTFPQAVNFRSYFIEGAIKIIQEHSKQLIQPKKIPQKKLILTTASIAGFIIGMLCYNHFKTAHLLDEASKELFTYSMLNNKGTENAQALYHLTKAAKTIDRIGSNSLSLPNVHQLKLRLNYGSQHRLESEFLPSLTHELEAMINNPANTPITRYNALKVYLMLGQSQHFSAQEIQDWFKQQWKNQDPQGLKNQWTLLEQVLSNPLRVVPINQQVITDARNYLNALPTSYLYYSLAKEHFPAQEEKMAIEGFNLATTQLPVYFTKNGFQNIIQDIPNISKKLQSENWVLARQDLGSLPEMLVQAYCFNYATWWHTFLQKSQPISYGEYKQGQQLAKLLNESHGMTHLLQLVQQHTQPDLSNSTSIFNRLIANQFTDLNLISPSSMTDLHVKISELERFLSTLSVINDGGKTAFSVTKSRFLNELSSDPVGILFNQARQFPEPLKTWTNKLAGDAWFILIKDSRQYINTQWQKTVYAEFKNSIAQRYPFYSGQTNEISMNDFNHFFSSHGVLNTFTEEFIKPFLDVSSAQWKPKVINDMILPLSGETLDEIMRANIITNMFYPDHTEVSTINFSLQKISLDPVVAHLQLEIGNTKLMDDQNTNSFIQFSWPQNNAKLGLDSIEGKHFELAEQGTWALFKLLEKVNVLIDEQDSSSLQILFEINGNSGRYLLKTTSKMNPFTPGILNGFNLNEVLV